MRRGRSVIGVVIIANEVNLYLLSICVGHLDAMIYFLGDLRWDERPDESIQALII